MHLKSRSSELSCNCHSVGGMADLQNRKFTRPCHHDWPQCKAEDKAGKRSEIAAAEDQQSIPSTHFWKVSLLAHPMVIRTQFSHHCCMSQTRRWWQKSRTQGLWNVDSV
jgi:hypothetical protein